MANVSKKINNVWYIVLVAPNKLMGVIGLRIKLNTI